MDLPYLPQGSSNQLSFPGSKKFGSSDVSIIILTTSLIFLHVGFTYYISFQILALLIIALLVLSKVRATNGMTGFFIGYIVFGIFLARTAVVSPLIVDQDGADIFRGVIRILGCAFLIGMMPYLRFRQPAAILKTLRSVSSATILVLAGLLLLSESNLISSLNREALVRQNVGLIENQIDLERVEAHFYSDLAVRPDLFYGEPSALAIVLFSCLGCFILTSTLLNHENKLRKPKSKYNNEIVIILLGTIILFYIQSLSAVIYGLTIIVFVFLSRNSVRIKKFNWKHLLFIILLSIVLITISSKYILYRVFQGADQSLIQRFGILLFMDTRDFLFGFDQSKIPGFGRLQMQNGVVYIIAISGLGGLLYIISLSYSVYKLSAHIKLSGFSIILVLCIMMQNMGVFSPNKIVLFSLFLLPLACGRSMYPRKRSVTTNGSPNR